jgi:hypothetical protein
MANGPDDYEYDDAWAPGPADVKDNITITLTVTRIGIHKAPSRLTKPAARRASAFSQYTETS